MKRLILLPSVSFAILAATSCALDDGNPGGGSGAGAVTGGQSGTSGGTASATGGSATNTGGSATNTGGSAGNTGGSATNTGGSATNTGGSATNTGGSAGNTGGTTGPTGGMGGATGGANGQGGSTAAGTTSTGGSGAGGVAGGATTGGSTNGGAASGGKSGGGTGGSQAGSSGASGAGAPSVATIAGKLDGYVQTNPCGANDFTGYDCVNSGGCKSLQPKTVTQDFTIGGDPATTYELNIRVRGFIEAKNYNAQCVRRAGTGAMDSSTQGGDFLCEGGGPLPSSYNEYSLTVTSGQVAGRPSYFGLNARNGTGEAHEGWALNYTFTLRVKGGGVIQYKLYDSNCRMITNCGADTGGSMCGNDQRILDLTNADPMPTLMQPYLGAPQANGPGQWVFLDVLSVTVVP